MSEPVAGDGEAHPDPVPEAAPSALERRAAGRPLRAYRDPDPTRSGAAP